MEQFLQTTAEVCRITLIIEMIMKKKINIGLCVIAALMLFAGTPASAQEYHNTPVTISKELVNIKGQTYYSHIVLEKQTLFSISKAYGVTLDQLYEANPGLKETGLKNGAILLIPKVAAEQKIAEVKAEVKAKEKDEVKPDVKSEDKTNEVPYIKHTVKWYENINGIAEKYGVSPESIKKLNGLKGNKLKKRMELKIPVLINEEEETKIAEVQKETESTTQETNANEGQKRHKKLEAFQDNIKNIFSKNTVNIAYLMPLNGKDKPNTGNMDFYSGALLAARDAANEGIEVKLNVHDIAGHKLPAYNEYSNSDLIIGPISSRDLDSVLNHNIDSTIIVSPLDPRTEQLVYSHPEMIMVPSPQTRQYEDLLNWINSDMGPTDRFIVIYEKGSREALADSQIHQLLTNSGLTYNEFSYGILEGRSITTNLEEMMNIDGNNRFLIASESEAFVNDMVRNLNLLIHDKYNVTMYGPSKIRSFDTIEIDNLHNTNFHCSLTYYIDYDNPEVQRFLLEYRALFNTEPTPFAYQGYDLTRYFTNMIHKGGKTWTSDIECCRTHMLQSDLEFKRAGINGGWINTGIRRIIYNPDYSIKLVK